MNTPQSDFAEQEVVLARWPAQDARGGHRRAKIERRNPDGSYGVSYTGLGIRTADTDAAAAADSPERRRVQYCPAVPASCICKMPTAAVLARLRSAIPHGTNTEQVFAACDSDADGRLTREEFRAAVSALDVVCTGEDIDAMIVLADTDGNGSLNRREFAALVGSAGGPQPGGATWAELGKPGAATEPASQPASVVMDVVAGAPQLLAPLQKVRVEQDHIVTHPIPHRN
jgi:hypothetical protein